MQRTRLRRGVPVAASRQSSVARRRSGQTRRAADAIVSRFNNTREHSEALMKIKKLEDGSELFDVSVRKSKEFAPIVLFAVGAGGNPERYVTLLDTLAESGCTVIAPHFTRLSSPRPTEAELTLRARRLRLALDVFCHSGETVSGVGHSIGAAILVALAGGRMWLGPSHRIDISADVRLSRLALLAPPTGFFQAPRALDSVHLPILVRVGSEDSITPPSQT